MRHQLFAALTAASFLLAVPASHAERAPAKQEAKLENLLRSRLERVSNTEVIVSRVSLPPNTAMPQHRHPGEEFAYVIEGSVTLSLEGKPQGVSKAGDVGHIPLNKIHSAKSGGQGAVILVFRVHEVGKPERVLVK